MYVRMYVSTKKQMLTNTTTQLLSISNSHA